jgi:hypothetical protein
VNGVPLDACHIERDEMSDPEVRRAASGRYLEPLFVFPAALLQRGHDDIELAISGVRRVVQYDALRLTVR